MSATILPFPERAPAEPPIGFVPGLATKLTVAVMGEFMTLAIGGLLPMPATEQDVLIRKAAYAILAVHAHAQDRRH